MPLAGAQRIDSLSFSNKAAEMMAQIRCVLLACGVVVAVAAAANEGPVFVGTPDTNHPLHANILALLVTPEKFDGRLIITDGYFDLGGGMEVPPMLFAMDEDRKNHRTANALVVELTPQLRQESNAVRALDKRRIVIEGVFRVSNGKRVFGASGNALTEVRFMQSTD